MVTNETENSEPFEPAAVPPPVGSNLFVSDLDALRDSGISPRFVSEYNRSEESRAEFHRGCELMGLGTRRMPNLVPQMVTVADACNAVNEEGAPLYATMGVLLPRRSSKTTSVFAVILGRCSERPGYLAGFTTCTTGLKARDRFAKDIVPALEALYPDEKNRPFRIRKSGGTERILFHNGSIFQVLPPSGESFRSDAFDCILLDEAGEASVEMTEDLMAGVLATFDTRPDAQLIVAGTAAKFRTGNLLWDTLEDGKKGKNRTGIVAYCAPESTTDDDLMTDGQKDWEKAKELVLAAHPGVGTLTTLDNMETRFSVLKLHQFMAEYLSIFGLIGGATGMIDMEAWGKLAKKGKLPTPPAEFAMAIAAHPDQISSCVVAAWRVRGKAHILVLDHRSGVSWLTDEATRLSRKYKTPILHDDQGAVMTEVESIARKRPKPKLQPQNFRNVKTAAALLIKEIEAGNLTHYDQPVLNDAALHTMKRSTGATSWALGRPPKNPEADIITMEAASLALRAYDDMRPRGSLKPSMAA